MKRTRDQLLTQAQPASIQPTTRAQALLALRSGESLFLEALDEAPEALIRSVSREAARVGLRGRVVASVVLAIEPATREVLDLVRITRLRGDHEQE